MGFGCASLMARTDRAESVRLLETALDAGITHFDVARSYGYGEAESAVGEFLRGRRDQVTVATKAGILPPARSSGLSVAKAVVRRVAGRSQRLRGLARRQASKLVKEGRFGIPELRASFETSLRELGVDHVDVFFLHECAPGDLSPELLDLLRAWQREGKLGSYGIATKRIHATAICTQAPQYATAVQVPDAAVDPVLPPVPGHLLTHSGLGDAYGRLVERLRGPEGRAASASVGSDLADPAVVARLMLGEALRRNPHGTVLTSSRNPAHIQSNAEVWRNLPPAEELDAFCAVLEGSGA